MSTLLALVALDRVVWQAGYHVALIDKTAEEKVVLIKADEAVDYGAVMAAMDQLRAAGAEDMGLITEKPGSGARGGQQ